jgi:hypothetical protein
MYDVVDENGIVKKTFDTVEEALYYATSLEKDGHKGGVRDNELKMEIAKYG